MHVGVIHTSGWIITRKMQVMMIQAVSTIRNNLIFANNGLVVFILQLLFIIALFLGFIQSYDFA